MPTRDKEEMVGADVLRQFEKAVMLQSLDSHWKEHLSAMDHLRQGIHLRGYAQKNPKQEYKRESFELFSEMLDNLKYDVVGILSKVRIQAESDVEAVEEQHRKAEEGPKNFEHQSADRMKWHHSSVNHVLVATTLVLVAQVKNISSVVVS